MTPSESAVDYAKRVVGGKVPAGKYVKLACKRFLADLKRKRWPYEYRPELADRAVRFMEKMPHVKGRWAAKKERLILEPWARFIECNLFGWVHKQTGLRRFRESYEEIPRKNGKALAIDTPVPTPDGWKPHGELRVGDLVYAPCGRPVKVLWVSEQYVGPCYEVRFADCPPIVAHAAHEWKTERTWYTGRRRGPNAGPLPLVETRQLAATLTGGTRGDFVHRIPVTAPIHCESADLPVKPYTLGAWLGDGSAGTQDITGQDLEVFEAISADGYPLRLKYERGETKCYSLWNGDRSLRDSTSLKAALRSIGVLNDKHIPLAYLRAGIEQRMELLRGLLDTDGHITRRGQIQFCSTNLALATGVMELVRSLGMKPSLRTGRAKLNGVDCGPKYLVEFFPATTEPLFKIRRKAERQRLLGIGKRRCLSRTVVAVDPCGDKMVNCIEVEGGLYLAGEGFVTTHNSTRVAVRGIYLFSADGEAGAEVYSGATTEKQALEVFRPAWQMVQRMNALRERYGIEQAGNPKNPGPMYVLEDMSRFETIIGKPGDGASPHAAIVDEYHEHDSDQMVDAMQTGMGAREQPLLSIITTAGSNLGGPCYEKRRDVIRILEGTEKDETIFGVIFGIDEGDRWDDPASLVKANPNYNVSVFEDFLLAQLAQARRSASKQNAFRTKHLNEWVGARTAWMNMLAWQRQKRTLRIEDFQGCRCWIGCDLATKLDVAALVMLFEKNGAYHVIPRFYVPESALEDNKRYQNFALEGAITVTPGDMTDYGFIEEELLSIASQVELVEVAFDPAQAAYLMTRLEQSNLPVIEFPQTVRNMSDPMKEVEARVVAGSLFQDGNPAMTWMMGNVTARVDAKEHVFPRKDAPEEKIDGPVGLIIAMGRAMVDEGPSVYESRGLAG